MVSSFASDSTSLITPKFASTNRRRATGTCSTLFHRERRRMGWPGLCVSIVAEVDIMNFGSLLFILAFAVIIIGPLAGLVLGLIGRISHGADKPHPRLEE